MSDKNEIDYSNKPSELKKYIERRNEEIALSEHLTISSEEKAFMRLRQRFADDKDILATTKRKNRSKIGRTVKQINFLRLAELCSMSATASECAAYFDVDMMTIENHVKDCFDMSFSDFRAINDKIGKISLRRQMHLQALSGDSRMLIHLAKHRLDQFDKQIVDNQSSDGSMTPTKITRVILNEKDFDNNE